MGNDIRNHNILIVDDIETNIDVLVAILKDEYDLSVALDGPTTLEYVNQEQVDLILIDVMMPGMDGYEVCRRLKKDISTRNIPVIFVTSMGEVTDETKGFELGAVDYITKPVSPPIVKARVRTQLALYDQNRELEKKVQQRTAELNATRLEIIQRLGRAAEFKDYETGLHVVRMSYYSRLISLETGFSNEHANLLLNASPMHDVGKIGIPDHILKKSGKLDPDEWSIMKLHTVFGAEILGTQNSELLQLAQDIALNHHERWDGSGYPNGFSGEEISIESRIVAIADVFDALTNDRPYKKAWPVDEALEHIREERGKHFDPNLVDAFFRSLPEILKIKKQYEEK